MSAMPLASNTVESFVLLFYFFLLFIFVDRKFIPFYYIAITTNSFYSSVLDSSIFINA